MFSGDINQLGTVVSGLMDRIAALEAQSAKDTNAIADKLIAAVLPVIQAAGASVDTMTLTVNASATEFLRLAKRIDGAKLVLGPDVPDTAAPGSMQVTG